MALQQHGEGAKQWAGPNALDDPSLVDDGVCLDDILGLVGATEPCPQPGGVGGRGDELRAHAHQQGGVQTPYVSEHDHAAMANGGAPARKDSRQAHRAARAGARRAAAASEGNSSEGHESCGAPASRRGGREAQDDVTDERKRNREAVRKYRARKKATLLQMEEELNELRAESANLKQLLRNVQAQMPESVGALAQQIRAALGDPEAPAPPLPSGSRHHIHLPSCRIQRPPHDGPALLPVLPPSTSHRSGGHALPTQQSVCPPEVPAPLATPRTRSAAAAAAANASASCAAVTSAPPPPQPPQQIATQLQLPVAVPMGASGGTRATSAARGGNGGNLGPAAAFASLFHATTCMLGKHMGDRVAPLNAAAGSSLQKKQRTA